MLVLFERVIAFGMFNSLQGGAEHVSIPGACGGGVRAAVADSIFGDAADAADACILQVAARVFSARSAGNSTFCLQSSASSFQQILADSLEGSETAQR